MRLADRIAQYRTPLVVQNTMNGSTTQLSGADAYHQKIRGCATRYVLSDDLIHLCGALAFSKGARDLACADWLRVPARSLWIEWCAAPWMNELSRYGFKSAARFSSATGRRGVFIESSEDGRRGHMRTFWSAGDGESDVLASSMEACFDFDTAEGDAPKVPDATAWPPLSVSDGGSGRTDVLRRCFRFYYERTWADYYANARLSPVESTAVAHHALGTIAIEMPVLLTFLLLLTIRPGLPRRPSMFDRLNQSRGKAGKAPLLDHIEVFAPLLPEYEPGERCSGSHARRAARLHHVRGHLVRRGSQLFWRVPHLRGSARAGAVHRTVTWTVGP